jgi:hypothetical protein
VEGVIGVMVKISKAHMNRRSLITVLLLATVSAKAAAPGRQLIRDPQFQRGFLLLEAEPGKRVVYAELPGLVRARPVWDLAQWSSRFPLRPSDRRATNGNMVGGNRAKSVVVGKAGSPSAGFSLAVNAEQEYTRARKTGDEPWVHLLAQQEFENPPTLGGLAACKFHVEARLMLSKLVNPGDYAPSLHAAQYFIYLTVANLNPKSAGYHECFWFGIPVYDNRSRVVGAYEAQDFGGTKLFIFTPSSDTFCPGSIHDGEWVTLEKDLLPLMLQGIEHARSKGFLKGSNDPADYCPIGMNIGWEVPGLFNVDLQIRNLSLTAVTRQEKK